MGSDVQDSRKAGELGRNKAICIRFKPADKAALTPTMGSEC